MTKNLTIVLVALAVPLLSALAYVTSFVLVSDEAAVLAEASIHVERARRLLHGYGENEERLTELLDQLGGVGVDVTLTTEQVEKLLEEDRSILEKAEEMLGAQSRGSAVSRRRDLDERYRAAGGDDQMGLSPARGFGSSLSQMGQSIVDALRDRDGVLARNEKLLQDASNAVSQALAVSRGDVTGAVHPQANRLKGVILMAQAGAAQRRAQRLRMLAQEPRRRLVELAGRVSRLATEQRLVEVSEIRDRVDTLHEDADRARATIGDLESRVQSLDATLRDLRSRIDEFREQAQTARTTMERLEDEGADLIDPDGFDAFAEEYTRLSRDYRQAIAQAHRLELGTLQNARIDDSGDYLRGEFVPDQPDGPIVVRRGLVDYQHDRETAALDLERNSQTLQELEMSIAEMEATARRYAETVSAARDEARQARSRIAETYQAFVQQVNEADAATEDAAGKIRDAIRAFRSAATLASGRARDAADRIAGASPAKQDRSPNKLRSESQWLAGQINNELAQAQYRLGEVLYERYAAAEADFLIASIPAGDLQIEEADPDEFAVRRDTAREEGTQAARAAVRELEKSSRDLDNNWTVAAQAGGAHYLLALLENPVHIESAIENYAAAVQGRETESYARAVVERLGQLRRR